MTEPDYAKYYNLEGYLFDEVASRFEREHCLSCFDFFCIVIWKANRSKSKIAKRLLAKGHTDLTAAVEALVHSLVEAADLKTRLAVLIKDWGFRLPMASAILTVLYPKEFTVYDVRVCDVLGDFSDAQDQEFDILWDRYSQYIERVKGEVPDRSSLREKDRYLWGKSFESQLRNDILERFGCTVDDSAAEA